MSVIGFESANSYVKIKSAKGEEIYPNVKRLVEYGEENLIGTDDSPVFRIAEDRYVVGERKFDFVSSSSREVDRYSSLDYRIESLIALAKHVDHGESVTVVTGLPSSHYNDKNARQSIINTLTGRHQVFVNDQRKIFEIQKVVIMLQPYAALLSIICDEFGNLRHEELMKTSNVVIDVGWGTTDVALLDGTKIMKSIPVSYSMFNAYKRIENVLRNDYPALTTLKFTPFDLEAQLKDGDTFSEGGETYQVGEIKRKAFEQTANDIMRTIKNEIQLKEYDHVFFAGGGVQALVSYLKSHLEGKNASKITNPQMAIVRGLYNYGVLKG